MTPPSKSHKEGKISQNTFESQNISDTLQQRPPEEKKEIVQRKIRDEQHHQEQHHTPKSSVVSVHQEHSHTAQPSEHFFTWLNVLLLAVVIIIVVVNQIQISSLTGGSLLSTKSDSFAVKGAKDLSSLDISTLKSTGHTVAAVFPVENIKTADDAVAAMLPSGTPAYGEALGVSFDDPINSLATLASMYRGLQAEVQKNNPKAWERFLNLALKPVGISCEYCCGVGPIGIDKSGNSRCGCQHNPALLSMALYLTAYTDYTDGEILREVMRWKTLFFPKNMIELGVSVAGGDTSKLELPGMVGGC